MIIDLSLKEKLRARVRRFMFEDHGVSEQPIGAYLPPVLMLEAPAPRPVRYKLQGLGGVLVEAVGHVAGIDMRPTRAALAWRLPSEVRT